MTKIEDERKNHIVDTVYYDRTINVSDKMFKNVEKIINMIAPILNNKFSSRENIDAMKLVLRSLIRVYVDQGVNSLNSKVKEQLK